MKKKKIYFKKLENFCGLEYLTLDNCPMYDDPEFGAVIDLKMNDMTKLAAIQVIVNMVPLRGLEVAILRNALGMSYEHFARCFKLSPGTVFKWEKAKLESISLPNDFLVRYFAAEKMKCKIPKTFEGLTNLKQPEKIVFSYAA